MSGAERAAWLTVIGILAGGCVDDGLAPVAPELVEPPAVSAAVVSASDVVELMPLPGETTVSPSAVNRLGQVVGTSGNRPVLWENGEPVELPTLAGTVRNTPTSINDAGQIAGRGQVGLGAEFQGLRALSWRDGTVADLGTLPGFSWSRSAHVDNAGRVVVTSYNVFPTQATGSFLWEDGQTTPLPPVMGDEETSAHSGNGRGMVVGVTSNTYEEPDDARDESRFVVWQDAEVIWLQDTPRPSPTRDGGNEAWLGISDAGDGYIVNTDVGGLWRWRNGVVGPWPFDNAFLAHGLAVSPGGLVLGGPKDPLSSGTLTELGIWKDEEFFPLDTATFTHCGAISDGVHVVCQGPGHAGWFVATLDFGSEAPSIEGVLAFFDDAVADGTLVGDGPGASGEGMRDALRRMLEEARTMIEAGAGREAICRQLLQVVLRSDGATPPPDFVRGSAAALLADRVQALMSELGCG